MLAFNSVSYDYVSRLPSVPFVNNVKVNTNFDVGFIFTSSCVEEGSCLIYVICVCLHIVVSNTSFVVFSLGFIRRVAMLPASLEYIFVIAPSVFSNVYLFETTTYFTYMSGCSICYSSSIQVTNEEHIYALYS
jgi:hypothetical protein